MGIKIQKKFENVPYGHYVMFDENGLLKTDFSTLGLKIILNYPSSIAGLKLYFNDVEIDQISSKYTELSDYGVLEVKEGTLNSQFFEINEFKVYTLIRRGAGNYTLE